MSSSSSGGGSGDALGAAPNWDLRLRNLQIDKLTLLRTHSSALERLNRVAKISRSAPTDLPPVREYRPKLIDLETQLKLLETTYGPDAPQVVDVRNSLELLKSNFATELGKFVKSVNIGAIDAVDPSGDAKSYVQLQALDAEIDSVRKLAKKSPAETIKLTRLIRSLMIETEVLKQLVAQSRLAQLQVKRNPNQWTVLDTPWCDNKPSNKKYLRNTAVGMLVGLLTGLTIGYRRGWKPPI